jgi:hypothetical protein
MSNQHKDDRHEAIAQRAYEIYLQRGGKDGLAEDDWQQAEAELDPYTHPEQAPVMDIATNEGEASRP